MKHPFLFMFFVGCMVEGLYAQPQHAGSVKKLDWYDPSAAKVKDTNTKNTETKDNDDQEDEQDEQDKLEKVLKKHQIEFGLFSPVNNHLSFAYEQLTSDDLAVIVQLGIIGISNEDNLIGNYGVGHPYGEFIELGIKQYFSPTYIATKNGDHSIISGIYFKSELVLSLFNQPWLYYDNIGNPVSTRSTLAAAALLFNIGKQWVLWHKLTFDFYAGIGVAFTAPNKPDNNAYLLNSAYYGNNNFSYVTTHIPWGFAFDTGVNIGIPF